ncbi:MAG: hypothetical protein OHK0052_19720 [Anaerolineales bacterium]
MRNCAVSFVALLVLWVVAGCTRAPHPAPLASPTPITPTGTPRPTLVSAASPSAPAPIPPTAAPTLEPPRFLRPQISLWSVLDVPNQTLTVTQRITYTNWTSATLTGIDLLLETNRYPGAFALFGAENGGLQVSANPNVNRLSVKFAAPLPPGATTAVMLHYRVNLPPIPPPGGDKRPQPFGYTARQINLVDWYAMPVPYRAGEGWLIHEPWYYGEHQVYAAADVTARLHLNPPDAQMVIAAGAPAVTEGAWLRFERTGARTLAFSLSPLYVPLTTTVGATTVQAFVFPEHRTAGEEALRATAAALALFNETFGEYKQPVLSAVEADFWDGMEYSGLFFLSNRFYDLYDGTPKGYLTIIAAHETAHQWWFERVGNDQGLEPWLDEGLCTFSERLFYERVHPEAVNWWQVARVNMYQPQGDAGLSLYQAGGFVPYRDAAYLRGAQFFIALREAMGEDAFLAFLREYAARFDGEVARAADFWQLLDETYPGDWETLRAAYFR